MSNKIDLKSFGIVDESFDGLTALWSSIWRNSEFAFWKMDIPGQWRFHITSNAHSAFWPPDGIGETPTEAFKNIVRSIIQDEQCAAILRSALDPVDVGDHKT